jgi:hypothetical protein
VAGSPDTATRRFHFKDPGMRALQLAMRMLGREWRSGELGVLLLALTVAVAALTGVGFLVNRIGQAVELQATCASSRHARYRTIMRRLRPARACARRVRPRC